MSPQFDVAAFAGYLTNRYILVGVLITVGLTIVPMIAGLVLGGVIALARNARSRWVQALAKFYIWLFRGTPLLVQLVIVYTGLPQLGIRLDVISSTLIAFTLNEAAFLAEIIRAGINSVGSGQRDAAAALGLRRVQTLRLVIMPQALRVIVPPLGNSVNGLLKATSLASVISMEELMRRAQVLMQVKFEVLELYLVVAIWYLALTSLWSLVQTPLERRLARAYEPTAERPANAPVLAPKVAPQM